MNKLYIILIFYCSLFDRFVLRYCFLQTKGKKTCVATTIHYILSHFSGWFSRRCRAPDSWQKRGCRSAKTVRNQSQSDHEDQCSILVLRSDKTRVHGR